MAASSNPGGSASKRRENPDVSRRQQQKRLKRDVEELFRGIDVDDDDWLGSDSVQGDSDGEATGLDNDAAVGGAGALSQCSSAASETANIGAPASPSASSESEVFFHPIRPAELFSDCSSSSSSDEEVKRDDYDLCQSLRKWYVSSKVNLEQLNQLLETLRPFHPSLPRDARTVVRTPRSTVVKELSNGQYVHLGLKSALLTRLAGGGTKTNVSCLQIDVNVDGMSSVSRSSNLDVWPILGRCEDLLQDEPFAIGIFTGASKPEPKDAYFEDFNKEVNELIVTGLAFGDKVYEVCIKKYMCDAPARAYCKSIVGHCGKNGCERCTQQGDHDGVRTVFEPQVGAPRTDESFHRRDDKQHHHKDLPPIQVEHTNFVSDFPLDPMHLVYHGSFKRFMQFLFGKEVNNAKLSAREISSLSVLYENLSQYIPNEFQRIRARPISLFPKWKATEHRLFLLYLGVVPLFEILSGDRAAVYKIFLHLHVAIRILSCPRLVADGDYVNFAEKLLQVFVKCCAKKSLFGPGFVSYNIHSLLHLCDDVRKHGDLMKFSCFVFENHLGILRRLVRSGVKVAQQLAHRLAEIDSVAGEPKESYKSPACLCPSGYDNLTKEYSVLSCEAYKLVPRSARDGFFMVGEDTLGRLKRIVKDPSGSLKIYADLCDNLCDMYTEPIESSVVGIFMFDGWTAENVCVDINSIDGKVMVLPHGNKKVAIRLLHTYC